MARGSDTDGSPEGQSGGVSQRLDQWLFFARIIKSRTLAATLIGEGKFRLNREKVEKASTMVKPGDVVTSSAHRTVRLLRVAQIGKRRGPATEAQTLYEDITPPAPPPEEKAQSMMAREPGTGRPTKKERRLIDKFRGRT
jgi:ribosome-associated heat shock protein Hsp15